MRAGLPISLLLHLGVFAAGSLALSNVKPLEESRVVSVELLTVSEFTDIRAALKHRADSPAPADEPELPMQVETSVENAQVEDDRVNITPDEETDARITPPPKPEESDEPMDEPEPERLAEAKPSFDLNRISNLIDKSKDTATVADSQIAAEAEQERLVFDDRAREGVGTGVNMTVSELDALNSAMYRCWRKPADATDIEKLVVRLQVDMLPGGFVGDVRVIDRAASRRNAPGNPFWDVAEMRAVQAVSKCAPYDFLPAEKFDQWQSMILNFRPIL